MTNFDPKKLDSFISAHKGLTPEEVKRLLEGKEESAPKKEEQGPSGYDAFFKPGWIIIVSRPGEKPEEYRVLTTRNGTVEMRSSDNPMKGAELISEEELKKIAVEKVEKKEDKPEYPPLSELFAGFNIKTGYNIKSLLTWKRKWLDGGELDKYRKNYGNISIEDEHIAATKKALEFYIQAIQTEGLSRDMQTSIISSIGLGARILTGVQHPLGNDIEYFIKHNLFSDDKYIERVRDAIEKIKNPPAPAAPAVEAVKPPTLADVRDTWPSYIIFEPKRGWSYLNKTLPIREWTKAGENIRPVFDEYREFMLKGSSKEQERKWELYRSLIDTKNRVVDALHKALDSTAELETAMQEAAELRRLVEEKKEEWKIEREEELKNKKAEQEEELKNKNLEAKLQALQIKFEGLQEKLKQEKEHAKALSVWQPSSERVAFIERLIHDAEKAQSAVKRMLTAKKIDDPLMNYYESRVNELSAQIKATDERYAGLSSDKRTGPVLRPSNLQKTRGTDTRTVTLRGGEKISVNDWLDREKGRKENKTKDETSARENTRRELLALHEEMYADDPDEYKRLYQYKKYLPGDITKEVADMVLRNEGGVRPPEEKTAEREEENRKAPINSLVDYRMTYSPARDSTLDWMPVGQKQARRVGDPEEKTPERTDSRTEEQKLEDQVRPRLAGFETLKEVRETPYGTGMGTAEEAPWRPQSQERQQEEDRVPQENEGQHAPTRQEQERKLGKISATLAAKMEKFMLTKWIKKHPLWFLLSTATFAGVVFSVSIASDKGEGPIAAAPTISAPGRMDYASWKAYLTPTDKKGIEIIEDITKFDNQKLLEKHFSSYVKRGDTIAAKNFLERKDADKIISQEYDHIPGCDDKQRNEAGCIILAAQDMAGALLAAANEKVKQGHAPYAFQSKLNNVITQGVTPEAYFKALREARREIESKA